MMVVVIYSLEKVHEYIKIGNPEACHKTSSLQKQAMTAFSRR